MNDGLGLDKPGGNKLYLNTFGGQFRSRVTPKNPPIPGAEVQTRITAKGKEVTECLIYSIEGVISSIHTNTKVNGSMTFNEFVINLKHETGKDYVLTFNQTSSDTFDILNRIRSEEHTSELQSRLHLVCRLLLEKKKQKKKKKKKENKKKKIE